MGIEKNKIKKVSKNFFKSFKDFISKGNVMDLAVAVIIGAAFGAIITSLVNDLLMPLITTLLGGNSVDYLYFVIPPVPWARPVVDPIMIDGQIINGTPIYYGRFLQAIINFLIISFVLFLIVKVLIQHKQYKQKLADEEKAKTAPLEIPDDIKLLMEIRDALRELKPHVNDEPNNDLS
ncbi:MAG: large conductance mechanosensitive channel protein MscL [Acholeplasmatales bacterium]|jgi:large conductance mechanosensitive channel|nr:large conductance mechanosensitive channel protein MscL [Acholeplasmatales bacterium]